MKIKEKYDSVKEKIKDNKESIIFWSVVTGYVGACVGLTVAAVKQYNRDVEEVTRANNERQTKIENAVSRGAMILPNPDGSLWILDRQQVAS